MANTLKKEVVQSLADLIEKHPNIAFIKFEKTTHQSLETLRKDLKKADAKVKVMKNSLLEKAVTRLGGKNKVFKEMKQKYFPIKESTAVIILGDDWGAGIKTFQQFSDKDKTLGFKMSLLDNTLYSQEDTKKIALLPSKTELMAKVIGQLKTPMTKMTYAMKYNMQKLTYILAQKSKTN